MLFQIILLAYSNLKKCLFGATNLLKNSDKEKWVYSGYGIAFDLEGSWNFGIDYAKNVVSFSADNSSSHTDNHKNNVLVSGEGSTYGINESFDQSLVLTLSKQE